MAALNSRGRFAPLHIGEEKAAGSGCSISDHSLFAQYAQRLVDNGYSVIPIQPGKKAPGKFISGKWHGLSKWQQYCWHMPNDAEIELWSEWPGAGIGFPCGHVVAIDIDIDDPEVSHRVAELARALLGDTPAVRIGNAPKQLLVYRAAKPFQSFDAKPLQVLALGRQFVGYGVHPSTGQPYHWPMDSLAEIEKDGLPETDLQMVRSFIAEAVKLIPREMLPQTPSFNAEVSAGSIREPATYEAVKEALEHIVSDQATSRKDWIEIGMAIKAGLGEEGRELWHIWSARDQSRYTAAETNKQWDSFKAEREGNSIGVGTLYHRAMRKGGWSPSEGLYLFAYGKEIAENGPAVDNDKLIEKTRRKLKAGQGDRVASLTDTKPVFSVPQGEPGWLRDLGGNPIGRFVRYICRSAFYPQPEMALAASMAAFGTAAGRRYRTPQDVYSNIYTIGVLDSGAGKDAPLQAAKQLLYQAGLNNYLGGSAVASGAAIVTALTKSPTTLFVLDEIGFLFEAAKSGRLQSGPMLDLTSKITEFYHQPKLWAGKAYADSKERPTEAICAPCLSILGMSTPARFWNAFTSMNASDGSLARFVVFESQNQFPMPQFPDATEIPDDIVEVARHLSLPSKELCEARSGNLDPRALELVVPYAEDAKKFVLDLMVRERDLKIADENTGLNAINVRITQNATKMALIRAVCENPERPVISQSCMEWGWGLAQMSAETIKRRIGDSIADNPHEANVKRVLRIIGEAGKNGIEKNSLTRKCQAIKKHEREPIIKDLVESGQVVEVPKHTLGMRGTLYIAAKSAN